MPMNFAPKICLVAALGILFGCGSSSEDNKSYRPQNGADAGNFNYHLTGPNCDTGARSFSNRADYCKALPDATLNDNCGLDARKEAYARDCGNDFEETNLGFIQISGYDTRLRKSCSVGNDFPAGYKFPRMRDYCAFLKDETLNENCFWEDRKQEFMKEGCSGSFSTKPYP